MSRNSIQEIDQTRLALKNKVIQAVDTYLWTLDCSPRGIKLNKKGALADLRKAYNELIKEEEKPCAHPA